MHEMKGVKSYENSKHFKNIENFKNRWKIRKIALDRFYSFYCAI